MEGLLQMDPKDRLTTKQALMHPFFDGLRTATEEEQIIKERERELSLKRTESSTNPRGAGTMSRNGDQSRSRSGLRNNKIVKGGPITNQKRFNQN
jgi:serine/threonine protein kinase